MKLFLIVCSEAEAHDAEMAEGWVKLLDARAAAARQSLSATLMQHRAKLIERYGLLFYGRRLLCRTCLGLRYGEAKRQHVNVIASITRTCRVEGAIGRLPRGLPPRGSCQCVIERRSTA